jgi:hypothetical protein
MKLPPRPKRGVLGRKTAIPAEPTEPTGGTLEADTADDLAHLMSTMKGRERVERNRFLEATDSEYWVALCFQTRAQKDDFLRRMDLIDLGDKYLDGLDVAARMGLQMERLGPPRPAVLSKRLGRLVRRGAGDA